MKLLRDNASALVPLAAAWYSVLAIAAANLRTAGGLDQLGMGLALATVVGSLAWLVAGLLTRHPARRTLVAVALVTWFAGYTVYTEPLRRVGLSEMAMFTGAAVTLVVGIFFARRTSSGIDTAAQLVRNAAVILLVFPLYSFASFRVDEWSSGMRDVPSSDGATPERAPPSIFLIVLDKYSGAESLRQNHGFDNRPFEERLRERGFFVPRGSRSNYQHTRLSLASMLNWVLLDELLADTKKSSAAVLNRAIQDNRTWRFLRERGYEFVFLPTTFSATRTNRFADRMIPPPRSTGANVGAAWAASTVARPVRRALMAGRFRGFMERLSGPVPYPTESAAEIEERFRILAALSAEPGRRFVFAHLLVPHEPYLFNADCSHRNPFWPRSDYVADQRPIRQAYIAQIQCVNRMLEELVDTMLSGPHPPPIILLQSDHGHGMLSLDPLFGEQPPLEQLDPAQILERTEIFAAYYLPREGASVMYDSITPVNVIPVVLNHYFGEEIALSEDAVFWGRLHPHFDLVRLR